MAGVAETPNAKGKAASTQSDARWKRRLTLSVLGGALLLLLLGMSALNYFHLPPAPGESPFPLFLFTAITVVLFVLLLLLVVLLTRNILRIYADGRSRVLGARLRSRMLLGALILSFAPIVFMALFSFLLMNRSLDRWFSQPVARLRDQSLGVALELSRYVTGNARAEAESLGRSTEFLRSFSAGDPQALAAEMRRHRITLEGGFAFVYHDGEPVASYQVPASSSAALHTWPELGALPPPPVTPPDTHAESLRRRHALRPAGPFSPSQAPLAATALAGAENADNPILRLGGGNDFALGAASFDDGGVVVVALPLPAGLGDTIGGIAAGAREYWAAYRERRAVRSTFLLLLSLVTALTFFASSWLALFLSKQITAPVEALADAMNAIAEGDYRQRIAITATEELSELIGSFNQMATDLEESRLIADSSAAQIEQANRRLQRRQHELELILETIPSGVVVLGSSRSVLQVNRAFLDLVGAPKPPRGTALQLEEIVPPTIFEEVLRLERRAQRMGVAGVELELPPRANGASIQTGTQTKSLSVTIAVLHLGPDAEGHDRRGSILVVDDVSDVLQAQRQVAWKEVAQRVAHEIKNPLTPILLSAERIQRHLDRATGRAADRANPESDAVIRKCAEVILASVESMRLLVDQFAALAEFPAAQPKAASLNGIAEGALLLFHGRLEGVRIEKALAPSLPLVLADPQGLKRALAILIDNAAEAMTASLHRVLRVETSLSERVDMAEITISDTGPGLSPEVRERLFLPYFSTKQRGTGLGLAIAAKIVSDHHGTIRAEQRGGSGASFVIELPLAKITEPSLLAEQVPA